MKTHQFLQEERYVKKTNAGAFMKAASCVWKPGALSTQAGVSLETRIISLSNWLQLK